MAPRPRTLAERLKALLNKGHFSMLLGAGASVCAGYPLMGTLTRQVLRKLPRGRFPLVHNIWDSLRGAPEANIESVLAQLYSVLAVSSTTPNLTNVDRSDAERCESAIQRQIARTFLPEGDTALHRRLVRRVCALNSKAPAVIATCNYDLLVERACELEHVWCLDGFVGSFQRQWSIDSLPLLVGTVEQRRRFRIHQDAIRFLKLHGSISWATDGDQVVALPDSTLPKGGKWRRRLVYPTPRKVDETLDEPYNSLLRHFSGAIDRPNGLLLTLGFSYRDNHLIGPIRQFLAKPDHTLIALVEQPEGALCDFLRRANVICVSAEAAWVDGNSTSDSLEIWQLPALVDFLEAL